MEEERTLTVTHSNNEDHNTILHRKTESKTFALLIALIIMTLLTVALSATLLLTLNGTTTPSSLVETYQSQLRHAKYIDLTHAFSPTSPLWSGFGPAQFEPGVAGKSIDGFADVGEEWSYRKHGFVTSQYQFTTDQLTTQLDPPAHWNEFGATISDIPATVAVRPLVVIDISAKVASNPSYAATAADVLQWEAKYGRISEGSVVFVRSDWSLRWEEYVQSGTPDVIPGVSLEALKLLHLSRRILFHGHEPLDTDMTPTLEGEAWLMHNNFAQAEGLAQLHLVPASGCLVSIGFAKPQGGTGGYARFVAICPAASPHGTLIEDQPGAPLPRQTAPLRRSADGVMRPTAGASSTQYCQPLFGGSQSVALGCNGTQLIH